MLSFNITNNIVIIIIHVIFSDGYTIEEIFMEWTNPNISNPTATDKDIEIAEFDLGDVTPYSCTMSYSTGK